jgi:acetyl esterase/lipase
MFFATHPTKWRRERIRMTAQELSQPKGLLAQGGPNFSDEPAVVRAMWEDMLASLATKAEVDDSLDEPGLRVSADRYLAGRDPAADLASPVFADLSGLLPLLIEVGSGEILLDDSTRLAAKAGADEVDVTLHVWPEMVHDCHFSPSC